MDPVVARDRAVWEEASQKHVREHQNLLDHARARCTVGIDLALGQVITAVITAGLQIRHVTEHPERFSASALAILGT